MFLGRRALGLSKDASHEHGAFCYGYSTQGPARALHTIQEGDKEGTEVRVCAG